MHLLHKDVTNVMLRTDLLQGTDIRFLSELLMCEVDR